MRIYYWYFITYGRTTSVFAVCHRQRKNIVLCVMEVARIAASFGIEPPGLVSLEREIEREEEEEEVFQSPRSQDNRSPVVTNGSGRGSPRSPLPTRIPTPRSRTPSGSERSPRRPSSAGSASGGNVNGGSGSQNGGRVSRSGSMRSINGGSQRRRRRSSSSQSSDVGDLDKQVTAMGVSI